MSNDAEPVGFRIPIHQNLVRHRLPLGGEPTLVYLSGGVCSLAFATADVRGYALGLGAWLGIMFILRKLAKMDPIASEVYGRFYNYPSYMSAQPSIVALPPPSHEMQ
jgi:type IV secretion system protein VirB3